jgi:hypothetical protein
VIEKVRGLFSVYPDLNITEQYDGYVVRNDHMNLFAFTIGDSGMYDLWVIPHQTCLSQNMVKVIYDVLVLLNVEGLV